ncbi:MAG TPA: 50S ribosomal protein L6 [Spongiibacteraceae bacterium]|nr:50S ribosomal protein L6 [Spongiibacteraceae bacterium]
MSRVAKSPVVVPAGVDIKLDGSQLTVKGAKGTLSMSVHNQVAVAVDGGQVTFDVRDPQAWAHAGTARALVNNMVVGVSKGFEKKLELIGVGYRAKAGGKTLNLTLGFSHPIDYALPEGVTAETPSQTEIILRASDKQLLGQAAAEIRSFRPPEPYKGKGIRYSDEYVLRKEAKKK